MVRTHDLAHGKQASILTESAITSGCDDGNDDNDGDDNDDDDNDEEFRLMIILGVFNTWPPHKKNSTKLIIIEFCSTIRVYFGVSS